MEYGFALTTYQINNKEYDICLRLDESRKMTDIHISENNETSILNNIYVGRIENIVNSIRAYFVRFQEDNICFLPFDEAKKPFYVLKQSKKETPSIGDLILVQITREALKEKDPAASCNLNLQGKYMVLTSESNGLLFSKKIASKTKEHIKSLFEEENFWEELGFGITIRTIAEEQTDQDLIEDYQLLKQTFLNIKRNYIHKSLYNKVYKEAPSYINYLKNQYKNASFITSDKKAMIDSINDYCPYLINKVRYYEDNQVSLCSLYNLKGNIESLLSKKVWLKSGGNIIIEQLETLTLIDVNSAKSNGKKVNPLEVNMEAVDIALQQISLRNISGMIIIDFINVNKEEQISLITKLKERVNDYPNPCKYIDTTKLGLVELTRKKIDRSIKEIC